MCGFAGYVSKTGAVSEAAVSSLTELGGALFHRGPNDGGFRVGQHFAVVHRRLSIIDAAHGQQPMFTEDGRLGLAYNGEIYNFKKLQSDLIGQGVEFSTDCDTEVLLALFQREGAECFRRLDGMFTAFIWDYRRSDEGEFHLVRDQLGIKPLYLYEDQTQWIFSSELSPMLNLRGLDLEVDDVGLASYFTYRYVTAPKTFFKRIRRVEGGCYVRITGGVATTWRYWDLPVDTGTSELSLDEAAGELRSMLRQSVAQQQMSEVPVGLLLSGGLDSSAIASLCADIGVSMTSFSIGFPDLNEFEYAEDVAVRFGLPHVAVETTPEEIVHRFDRVVAAMDEPIADPACFPLHILCDSIKSQVTVVLSGEGSDEMFAGYPQYALAMGLNEARPQEKFGHFMASSWYFHGHRLPLNFPQDPSRSLLQKIYFDERPPLSGMLAFDQKTWLPENLMAKADKILMSHSLEGRFPFLSTGIIEFAASLPDSLRMDALGGKAVLRRAFSGSLPASVIGRKKMGFSVPVSQLLERLKDRFRDLLESRKGPLSEYIDYNQLITDFDDHFSGRREQSLWLWTVLVLLQWQSGLGRSLQQGQNAGAHVAVTN